MIPIPSLVSVTNEPFLRIDVIYDKTILDPPQSTNLPNLFFKFHFIFNNFKFYENYNR
jgi:hypothetical protein